MRILSLLLGGFLLSGICGTPLLWAAQPVTLSATIDTYPLSGSYLEFLEDSSGSLTIEDILTPGRAARFRPVQQHIPNYGMTDSAFWFRLTIDPGETASREWYLYLNSPLLDTVELYLSRDDGSIIRETAGIRRTALRGATRNPSLRLPALSLPSTLYLRVHEPGRAVFPMRITTGDAMADAEARDAWLAAGYVGVMLAILLLCSFLYLMLRERQYLTFALLILFLALFNLLIKGYLLPILPDMVVPSHHLLILWLGCASALAEIVFGWQFLQAVVYAPRLNRFIPWLGLAMLVTLLVVSVLPISFAMRLMGHLSTLGILLMIWLAMIAFRKGYSPAAYYLLSYLFLGASVLWMMLVTLAIVPFNFMADNFQMLNSVVHVLFICLALAARFRGISRQNEALIADLRTEVDLRTVANRELRGEMAARQQLEREIVRISDNERRRMSHELHDGLCQQLTGARLRFAAIAETVADTGLGPEFSRLGGLLDQTVETAYRLSRGLWTTGTTGPGVPLDLGELTRQLSAQSGIQIELDQRRACPDCTGENLPQIHLIAREAIWNAIKHSGASVIRVTLACDQHGGIRLEVADDGQGFGDAENLQKNGMGLKIMRHRAEMIGGTFQMAAAQTGGVLVTCTAPCALAKGSDSA